MRVRVLLGRRFAANDVAYLKAHLDPQVMLVEPADFHPDTLRSAVSDGIDVFLGEPSCDVLQNHQLKLIQIPWTGVDRLDFAGLKSLRVPVCNSHSNADVVAEHALALLLSAAKSIAYHDRKMRAGDWCRPGTESFRPPTALKGATALIVGLGSVGDHVARALAALGLIVDAVVARPRDAVPSYIRSLRWDRTALVEGLACADFVVLAMPLTEDTNRVFGRVAFESMKKTAFLINVSRGDVIDEAALYEALSKNEIRGAAIDTWYNYPSPSERQSWPSKRFAFQALDNLILSPHRAGFSDGKMPHLDDAIENINRLASGQQLINVVDLDAGY